MSRKAKYTVMAKIEAVERYLRGEASAAEIAAEMKMGKNGKDQITAWAAIYRENGIEGFHLKEGNGSYTAEEKQQAVEEYLQRKGSLREICRKHHIPSSWTLWQWIKRYNSNKELRDYNPKPEVYVAMGRRLRERSAQNLVFEG